MKSLSEWSRNMPAVDKIASNINILLPGDAFETYEVDESIELLEGLINSIIGSTRLVELASSVKMVSAKLDIWLEELHQSLDQFHHTFLSHTREHLAAVILPWLRGKVTEKAVDDICFELTDMAKNKKHQTVLLCAPLELRPILEQRLKIVPAASMEEGSEIAIQVGGCQIQTDIELLLEKVKRLLLS